jgi:hypothetical protein
MILDTCKAQNIQIQLLQRKILNHFKLKAMLPTSIFAATVIAPTSPSMLGFG